MAMLFWLEYLSERNKKDRKEKEKYWFGGDDIKKEIKEKSELYRLLESCFELGEGEGRKAQYEALKATVEPFLLPWSEWEENTIEKEAGSNL